MQRKRVAVGDPATLRVGLVAGTLGKGGAEKQLVYMAQALQAAGVQVRVYCLTQSEYYQRVLAESGLAPTWFGQLGHPLHRAFALWRAARDFRPHILQSAHFYTNPYAALAARPLRALSIGAIRSSTNLEIEHNGRWAHWMLNLPDAVIANSEIASQNALAMGFPAVKMNVLPNAIDLADFDRAIHQPAADWPEPLPGVVRVALVARLIPVKCHARFLRVLALARQQEPRIQGVLIGDGPERERIQTQAAELGLLESAPGRPTGVLLLGERNDIPALVSRCQMLALTSDQEGFPNVILEAMTAGLPVLTTPVGEATIAVQDGRTGYVLPFEDEAMFASRLVELARQPTLREQLGAAGRQRVEQAYSLQALAPRLLAIYQKIDRLRGRSQLPRMPQLPERGPA